MASLQQGYKSRDGRSVPIDEAFMAWTSGDLHRMIGALSCRTHPVDRHFLLMGIVDQAYKLRSNPDMATLCRRTAKMHLDEFPAIAPILAKEMGGKLPRVSTFQQYATLLADEDDTERAIDVCNAAIAFGLDDGTKAGFSGRIERLQQRNK